MKEVLKDFEYLLNEVKELKKYADEKSAVYTDDCVIISARINNDYMSKFIRFIK